VLSQTASTPLSFQLQEKKSAMIDATLSADDSVSCSPDMKCAELTSVHAQAMGRLTPEDVSDPCYFFESLHSRVIPSTR
jgi:hypothetical protein